MSGGINSGDRTLHDQMTQRPDYESTQVGHVDQTEQTEQGVVQELLQSDTLSPAAKTRLKILTEFLMPELPAGDSQKLIQWLRRLVATDVHEQRVGSDQGSEAERDAVSLFSTSSNGPVAIGGGAAAAKAEELTTPPTTTPSTAAAKKSAPQLTAPTPPVLTDEVPVQNPYLQPGFMALLSTILSEIQQLVNKSVIESAQMTCKFIDAINQNAQAQADATIAGGWLQMRQNDLDADKYKNESMMAYTQGALTLAVSGLSLGLQHGGGKVGVGGNSVDRERYAVIDDEGNRVPGKYDDLKYNAARTAADERVSTFMNSINSFQQKMIEGSQSATAADITRKKNPLITSQKAEEALSQMLSQFISAMQQSMQTTQDMGKSATEFWHQILELEKSYAQTSGTLWQRG